MNARIALLLALALPFSASAEITGKVIKIGVLNDQSGLYADLAGNPPKRPNGTRAYES